MASPYAAPSLLSIFKSILIYIVYWILLSVPFYLILVLPFYPPALGVSYTESLEIHHGDYIFNILNQLVSLLGAIGAFIICRNKKRDVGKYMFQLVSEFKLNQFAWGVVISVSVIACCVLILFLSGFISFQFISLQKVPHIFLLYVLVAVGEEVVFRGYLFPNLREKFSIFYAILISSFLFALIHLGNPHVGIIGFSNIFLFGTLTALLYDRYQNLSAAIGAHFAWNFLQTFSGFAVSGQDFDGVFGIKYISTNYYLTGGAFGLEGSILPIPLLVVLFWAFKNQMHTR
jgi:uncharacterized protein